MIINPYTLIVDGKLVGYFRSIPAARYAMDRIKEMVDAKRFSIYYEGGDRQELVEEE